MDLPKIKAVLFTGKTYSTGTHPILIRISHNRKHSYKSVGFSVPPEAWDNESSLVYTKKPQLTTRQEGQLNSAKLSQLKEHYKNAIVLTNAKHINSIIENAIAEINTLTQKLKINDQSLDVKSIKSKLNPNNKINNKTSIFFCGKEMHSKYLKAGSIGTAKRYRTVLNKLSAYVLLKRSLELLSFG